MKRLKINWFVGLLTSGMLTVASGTLHAQNVAVPVTIQLTALVQEPDNLGNPIHQTKTTTLKFTTTSLLKLMATALNDSSIASAKLVVSNNIFFAVSKTRAVNLSHYLNVADHTAIEAGKFNDNNGMANYTGSQIKYVTFDDGHGNACELTCLNNYTVSDTARDKKGNQKETVSADVTMIGQGQVAKVGGNSALFAGTVIVKGNGTFTVR